MGCRSFLVLICAFQACLCGARRQAAVRGSPDSESGFVAGQVVNQVDQPDGRRGAPSPSRGRFLIMATSRQTASGDTAGGSDSPGFPSPGAPRSNPPSPACRLPVPEGRQGRQVVVSARNRAANATFSASPLGRVRRSASFHRRRFNSSAMICSATCLPVGRSLPPSAPAPPRNAPLPAARSSGPATPAEMFPRPGTSRFGKG